MQEDHPSTHPAKSILVLSGVKGDTRRYRALHLIEQLRLCGVDARFVHLTDQNFTKVLASRSWDMVIFQRVAYVKFLGGVIEGLQKNNILMVSDFDDLIFDPSVFEYINSPDFADNIRSSLYKDTMQRIRGMLDCTQGILASTDYLAGQIRRLDKPVWVHRNAFSLKMLKISEEVRSAARIRDPRRVVIGYGSGTPTHNRDFEMIRPALKKVMLKYPQVELQLIGPLDPGDDWQGLENRIRSLKLVPWSRLPWLLADFDINLAPLVMDNPFSQSKSEIKWMEAAMVNVPTVASPTDAYAFAIRSGENGFLTNTQEEWVETLSNLVMDAELRNHVGKLALDTVLADYHPAKRAKELVDRLEDIHQSCQGKVFWSEAKPEQESITVRVQKAVNEGGWVPEQFEKGPSYFQMGLYTLRTTGFLATVQFMWIFFRRMISPIVPFNKRKIEK
ncbi:MAG: glycosyltransferase family 4 protein [Anaerolineaceae bacterium]|nr:glycosyltransferase family 4 protein [Anaerolineaceae bacterium]